MTKPIYRSDFPRHCRIHPIDGMTLLFHRPSGATHFLDSPVPQMLALLAAEPRDAGALTAALCRTLGIAEDEEALMVVERRLADLVGIGLVQAG